MNENSNELKFCKKCGKILLKENVRSYGKFCSECYNAVRRQKRKMTNIKQFAEDDSMKVQVHYKEIHPIHILETEQLGINLIAADEVFVKLLDYKDTWISNYGRAISYYNNRYSLARKKIGNDGDVCYQLNRNVFNGKNWVWRKRTIEAWKLVVKEFIVNYDVANNSCCWHRGNDKEDNYYKHLYPLNKYQYGAVLKNYEECGDDSEEYIIGIINSVDYRPDGWNPGYMRKSMFGIGYLGCSDVDVQSTIYRKWANMMQRCYSEVTHRIKPYYKDCRVCEEWWNFSNFREWYRENAIEGRKFDLDKDILIQGNNIYSPRTCSLVTHYANTIFQRRGIETNITQNSSTGMYDAVMTILGKMRKVGTFGTREDAEKGVSTYRKELINNFARKNRNKVPYKVCEAMLRWDTEIAC